MSKSHASKTPVAMKQRSDDFFESAIHKRERFANLIESSAVSQIIERQLSEFHTMYVPNTLPDLVGKYVSWIGGSRSWQHWFQNIPSEHRPQLTNLERASIRAGNYDVFMLTNNAETWPRLACDVNVMMLSTKRSIEDAIKGTGYKVRYDTRGITIKAKSCTHDEPPLPGESFPGYGHLLYLVPDRRSAQYSFRDKTSPQGSESVLDEKLVFYLEIFSFHDMNLSDFSKYYLEHDPRTSLNYLSPLGLLTFSHFIKVHRKEKGVNVDFYRQNILLKQIEASMGLSPYEAYTRAAHTYDLIWSKSENVYDADFSDELRITGIKRRSTAIEYLMEEFQGWLMEKVRPYLNTCISETAAAISHATKGDAFLMIVGGDAMRRYRSFVTKTKDIDAKVYVTKHSSKTAVMKILDKKLVELVYQLIVSRLDMFREAGGNTLAQLSDQANDVQASIEFYRQHSQSVQFRLRQIDKNDDLPVTLYSVDYRCYIHVTHAGKTVQLKHDIPILDIVVQDNTDGLKASEVVSTISEMPIASLKFLLSDIVHTYKQYDLASMRFWGRKRDKDLSRYRVLREIWQGNAPATRTLAADLGVKAPVRITDKDTVDFYACAFKSVRTKNRRQGLVKHKLPFDLSKIRKRYTESCQAPPATPARMSHPRTAQSAKVTAHVTAAHATAAKATAHATAAKATAHATVAKATAHATAAKATTSPMEVDV